MTTLLVRHAMLLISMDDQRREIPEGGFFARDGIIEQVGPTVALPSVADEVLDLHDHLVLPGLVNTHHHFYQTLTRAVPAAQNANLFNWLKTLYPIWARLPPPDSVVEDEDSILRDSQRLIEKYHDPNPGAFVRVVLAPCSPFSVTADLMRQSAALARQYGVHLHTHLAETQDEESFCLEKFGHRPVDYMKTLNWVGEDVWFAHSVHVNPSEIDLYSRTGCGVAHCPTSNMRLASGIAPSLEMLARGVRVGLGVDGSARDAGSHLIAAGRRGGGG